MSEKREGKFYVMTNDEALNVASKIGYCMLPIKLESFDFGWLSDEGGVGCTEDFMAGWNACREEMRRKKAGYLKSVRGAIRGDGFKSPPKTRVERLSGLAMNSRNYGV